MVENQLFWATGISVYRGDNGKCIVEVACRDDEGTYRFEMHDKTLTDFCAEELPKRGYILKKGGEFGASGSKQG